MTIVQIERPMALGERVQQHQDALSSCSNKLWMRWNKHKTTVCQSANAAKKNADWPPSAQPA